MNFNPSKIRKILYKKGDITGEDIRYLRKCFGLTNKGFAEKTGIPLRSLLYHIYTVPEKPVSEEYKQKIISGLRYLRAIPTGDQFRKWLKKRMDLYRLHIIDVVELSGVERANISQFLHGRVKSLPASSMDRIRHAIKLVHKTLDNFKCTSMKYQYNYEKWIREERIRRGVSQRELSRYCKRSPRYIKYIENGRLHVSYRMFFRIARILIHIPPPNSPAAGFKRIDRSSWKNGHRNGKSSTRREAKKDSNG